MIRNFYWLTRDTFRQSLASGIFWLLLALSGLATLVSLSLHVDPGAALAGPGENPDFLPRKDVDAGDQKKCESSGVAVVSGQMTLGFGAVRLPLARDGRSAVHFLELILAGGVADTLGLLLTLVWTAGFLPGFLEARSVSVLLAKPPGRLTLLLGKYVGVLAFVLVQAMIFVASTWLAIGCRSGVWDPTYFWAIPLLLLHFSIFFSVSLLLAVLTHSTVVCVFGSIAFWGLSWGMNYGRHALALADRIAPDGQFDGGLRWLADAGYWILPKPADFGLLLCDLLEAGEHFGPLFDVRTLEPVGFSFLFSILTSLAFTAYVLTAASRTFQRADY